MDVKSRVSSPSTEIGGTFSVFRRRSGYDAFLRPFTNPARRPSLRRTNGAPPTRRAGQVHRRGRARTPTRSVARTPTPTVLGATMVVVGAPTVLGTPTARTPPARTPTPALGPRTPCAARALAPPRALSSLMPLSELPAAAGVAGTRQAVANTNTLAAAIATRIDFLLRSFFRRRKGLTATRRQWQRIPAVSVPKSLNFDDKFDARGGGRFSKQHHFARSKVTMLRVIPLSAQFGITRHGVDTCSRR